MGYDSKKLILNLVGPLQLVARRFKFVKKFAVLQSNTHLTGNVHNAAYFTVNLQWKHGAGAKPQLQLDLAFEARFGADVGRDKRLVVFNCPIYRISG